MVSAARKERDAMDRRNDQLRSQLRDTEGLLASHQEQLAELKAVMQQISKDNEPTTSTPPTPAIGDTKVADVYTLASTGEDTPCPPTSLTALVRPVLRYDISAYQDFCELLHAPKPTPKSSTRLSSGSLSQVMGMGISLTSPNQSPIPSPGFFGRKQPESATHSPSNSQESNTNNHLIAQGLKETKFFKRALVEDVEPALRLDCAPGISWYARRGVISSVIDGSLVIEPTPTTLISSMLPCAMCGENRRDEQHVRNHRMRTNDNKDSQTHTLCLYCVNRLRSVCDFLAFLRTLREGLWKCETDADEKNAWEESVKLRERMFWNRIGGGVVPVFDSRRTSLARQVIEEEQAPETPPKTPELKGQGVKLDMPKKRNPWLTPERQQVHETEMIRINKPLPSINSEAEKLDVEAQIRKENYEAQSGQSRGSVESVPESDIEIKIPESTIDEPTPLEEPNAPQGAGTTVNELSVLGGSAASQVLESAVGEPALSEELISTQIPEVTIDESVPLEESIVSQAVAPGIEATEEAKPSTCGQENTVTNDSQNPTLDDSAEHQPLHDPEPAAASVQNERPESPTHQLPGGW